MENGKMASVGKAIKCITYFWLVPFFSFFTLVVKKMLHQKSLVSRCTALLSEIEINFPGVITHAYLTYYSTSQIVFGF